MEERINAELEKKISEEDDRIQRSLNELQIASSKGGTDSCCDNNNAGQYPSVENTLRSAKAALLVK